jgi:hypothetical protein
MTTRSALLNRLAASIALLFLTLLLTALCTGCQSQSNPTTVSPQITLPTCYLPLDLPGPTCPVPQAVAPAPAPAVAAAPATPPVSTLPCAAIIGERSPATASRTNATAPPYTFIFITNVGGDVAKPIDVSGAKDLAKGNALGDTAIKAAAGAIGGAGGAALGGPAGAALGAAATTTAANLLTPKPTPAPGVAAAAVPAAAATIPPVP